jgi:hypothetical protein
VLVFVPFLWLALVHRHARDWVVLAVYLAAEATLVHIISAGLHPSGAYGDGSVIAACLLVIAPVHAWVAFSPAAGMMSWRDARAARAVGKCPAPVMDPVAPQELH